MVIRKEKAGLGRLWQLGKKVEHEAQCLAGASGVRRFYVAANVTYKKQKGDRGRIMEQPKGALRDELSAQEYGEGDFCKLFFIFYRKKGLKSARHRFYVMLPFFWLNYCQRNGSY